MRDLARGSFCRSQGIEFHAFEDAAPEFIVLILLPEYARINEYRRLLLADICGVLSKTTMQARLRSTETAKELRRVLEKGWMSR